MAANGRIALLIMKPEFDYSRLHKSNSVLIQEQIGVIAAKNAKPLYSHEIVQKGMPLDPSSADSGGRRVFMAGPTMPPVAAGSLPGYATRSGPGPGMRTRG